MFCRMRAGYQMNNPEIRIGFWEQACESIETVRKERKHDGKRYRLNLTSRVKDQSE